MSVLRALCVVTMAVAAVRAGSYTNRWDNLDVDRILKNERLLRTYFRCVMDQGRCSTDAAELRKNIPEALSNDCAKCTDKQKQNIEKVMKYLYEKRPEMFTQLEKKYDHQGTYRKKYNEGSGTGKAKGTEAAKTEGIVKAADSEKTVEAVKAADTAKEEETDRVTESTKAAEVAEAAQAAEAVTKEETVGAAEEVNAEGVNEGEAGKEKESLKVTEEVKEAEEEKTVETAKEADVVKVTEKAELGEKQS